MTDQKSPPRAKRRGRETMRQAIRQAMLDELVEHGYGDVSIEGVALRAGAAKTSVYRYWPTKEDLIIDALEHVLPSPEGHESAGRIRDDFRAAARMMARSLAEQAGNVLMTLVAERRRHPAVAEAVMERLIRPRQQAMLELLRQAAARGEITAGSASAIPVLVGSGLLLQHFMHHGTAPDDEQIDEYIDQAVMPLLVRPEPSGPQD
ncbi:TetR/AcrR family transcriptional regulator [Nonomuraea diastatica]|uniref:TetR/AcrR family transcriptional regulator n=1 Tax=Nonomuraea diastatica TaxID=1848329 RepID=A0A4R4WT90_9ACTN|nr:TetR/AcrR family transcriptional regulator [Nonomuraea diastatica]TDD20821.1 TetR/AcrR family transcriptional regulator [Nonomuraea diastatica]